MHLVSYHFAVFGQPVLNSLSPKIHQLFAKQAGFVLCYDKIAPEAFAFHEAAKDFMGNGGDGFNVTMPFKQVAYQLVDSVTEYARAAGAVNTVGKNEEGLLWGDNTDGRGFIKALSTDAKFDVTDKTVLILGAGGAVRGLLPALLALKPRRVLLLNRSFTQAKTLAEGYAPMGVVEAITVDDLASHSIDLLINALAGGVVAFPARVQMTPSSLVYDLNYGVQAEVFLAWAKQQGVSQVSDGLSMLVHQAALAFEAWTGYVPDAGQVLKLLRAGGL